MLGERSDSPPPYQMGLRLHHPVTKVSYIQSLQKIPKQESQQLIQRSPHLRIMAMKTTCL
ncbi:hypothetical protein H6G89_17480 [Oscillatoria sp. FACHB-1407]|uniref:hypothetical protein n=1 Tax=Oscillatoria sp. FACHB-1407 TaxID=2692847 RepID=UPI0016862ED4|nr:hypothetical protein [Oscillatoria sp. FACHB-1407]MBD2462834.1 hypothetical protein [Oscillatoria sp. FACHB-1407]